MSVYSPLEAYLKNKAATEVPMTFAEIAAVLGRALPQSAFNHRPWWANEALGHSHAKAWMNAGFETAQVDMASKKLIFRRTKPTPPKSSLEASTGLSDWAREFRPKDNAGGTSLFGALKGTFTIEPGWDLTTPSLDDLDIDKTADLIDSGLRPNS